MFLPFIGDGNLRVEIGFALTAFILFASLYLIYLKPKGIEEDIPVEGSSEAIEAKLAGLEDQTL